MSAPVHQPVSNRSAPGEPEASDVAVPVWLIVLLALLLYWGAIYFDDHGGWFDAKVYAPYRSIEEVTSLQPAGGEGITVIGARIYSKTCFACHQPNGQGLPGQFPPLIGSEWVNEPEPGRVIRIILGGLQGPITVKQQAFNGVMTPFGSPPPSGLSDEDIAAVLTFVRQNKEWGNNAPPVTPEQVKAVRDKVKSHPNPFTPDELLKISPAD